MPNLVDDEHIPYVELDDLQEASTLHVLAISEAPLNMVRLVHEADPSALTEDVLIDACKYCTSLEVVQYLKENIAPESCTPDKIAPVMQYVIQFKNSESVSEAETKMKIMSTVFPEALVHAGTDIEKEYPIVKALRGLNHGDQPFTDDLAHHMIQCIPSSIKEFVLPYDIRRGGFRLDLYRKIIIALTKTKVKKVVCREPRCDSSEFGVLITTLIQGTASLTTLELLVPPKQAEAPAPLHCLQTSQIWKLHLAFIAKTKDRHQEGECPDFSPLQMLVHMKQLTHLDLWTSNDVQADRGFCDDICQVLSLGRLEALTISAIEEQPDGIFFPLFSAVASTPSLERFQLTCFKNDITAYQDRLIEILENNTAANVHIWMSGSREKKDEKLIHYYTILNRCGRDTMAKDSSKASDIFKVLLAAQEDYLFRLTMEQVLYGLLRESPDIWSAIALDQDSQGRGLKRKASS